jgi:hypothetical protein
VYNEASADAHAGCCASSNGAVAPWRKEANIQFRKDGGVFASDGHVIVFRRNEDSDDRIRGRAYFALRDFNETAGAPWISSA